MSIEETLDPISVVEPDASPEDAREIGASLVRSGSLDIKRANEILTAKGATPLAEGSLEEARGHLDRLKSDPDFVERYFRGEPDAMKAMHEASARVAGASSKSMMDRPAAPAQAYHFDTAKRFPDLPDSAILKINEDATALAQSLQLSPAVAADIVAGVRNADAMVDGPEKDAWRNEQEKTFTRANKCDASSERVQNASKLLSEVSGRKIDLPSLVRTAGAEVATLLLLQAEHLQVTRKTQ